MVRRLKLKTLLFFGTFACVSLPTLAHDSGDWKDLKEAQEYLQEKKYDKVEETIKEILEDQPDFGHAYQILGRSYYEAGKLKQARKAMARAVECGRVTKDVLAIMLDIDLKFNDMNAALGEIQMLMTIDPENDQWYLIYADTLTKAGKLDQAFAVLQKRCKKQPRNPELWLRMGNVCSSLSKYNDAVKAFETAYHLGRKDIQIVRSIAGLWYRIDNVTEALKWYKKVSEAVTQKDWQIELRRAQLMQLNDKKKQAKKLAEKVSSCGEKEYEIRALILLGQMAMADTKADVAVKYWEQAIAKGSQDSRLYGFLGNYHYNEKNFEKAYSYLIKRAQGEDVAETTLYALAVCQSSLSKQKEARQTIQKYIELYGYGRNAKQLIRLMTEDKKESSGKK